MQNPKLSIVLAVRNDNYGGDFIDRLQRCIDWNTKWLESYAIPSEFVLVNWNPVADHVSLAKLISWPDQRRYVEYRVLEVPEATHDLFVDPSVRKTVPLFEFIAKNAGIRRAKGSHILCINADILIHPEIFRFISSQKLDDMAYYRANRVDFKKADSQSVAGFWSQAFAVSLKGFMYHFKVRSNREKQYRRLVKFNRFRLRWEWFKFRHPKLVGLFRIKVVYNNGGYLAHCLNSGDFMLMAKENWMKLKAYPEYTAISTHTDAIFTVLAWSRLEEMILPQPVFHQEHERRYTWEAIKKSEEFIEAYRLFEKIAADAREGLPTGEYLNKDDWGLADCELKEERINVVNGGN